MKIKVNPIIIQYNIKPLDSDGKLYQLTALLDNGHIIFFDYKGSQSEMNQLAKERNKQLYKGN